MQYSNNYSVLDSGAGYCDERVSLSVCGSVCLSASISQKPRVQTFACRRSSVLVWPLEAMQCVMYFRFLRTDPMAMCRYRSIVVHSITSLLRTIVRFLYLVDDSAKTRRVLHARGAGVSV